MRAGMLALVAVAGLEAAAAFAPGTVGLRPSCSARAMSGMRGGAPITQTSMTSAHDFKLPTVGVCLPGM